MRQVGACKFGAPLEGGRAALQAMVKYCSDDIPGGEHRFKAFQTAKERDAGRLLAIMQAVQAGSRIPEDEGGELVSSIPNCEQACDAVTLSQTRVQGMCPRMFTAEDCPVGYRLRPSLQAEQPALSRPAHPPRPTLLRSAPRPALHPFLIGN